MFSVDFTNSSKNTLENLSRIEYDIERGIRQGWFNAGDELTKELNEQVLKRPRSGRVYVRRIKGGSRRRHIASRAGETPANRTGRYRKGRGYKIRGWQQLEFGVKNVPYAEYLENGTRKMQPRPGVKNAYEAKKNQIQAIMESKLNNLFLK